MFFRRVVVFNLVFRSFGRREFDAALGNELHLLCKLRLACEYFAERLLVAVVAVDVGVVEGGDAFIEGGIDELFEGVCGDVGPSPGAGDYS